MSAAPPTRPAGVPGGPPSAGGPRPQPGPGPAGGAAGPTLDPVKIVLRYKWLLTSSVVVGAIVGVGLNALLARVAPVFVSEVQFQVEPQEVNPADLRTVVSEDELERYLNTQAGYVSSPQFLKTVSEHPRIQTDAPRWASRFAGKSGYDSGEARLELEEIVSSRPVQGTSVFRVTVSGSNPDDPFAIATVMRDLYMDELRAAGLNSIRARTDQIRKQITELDESIQSESQKKQRMIRDEGIEQLQVQATAAAQNLREVSTQLNTTRNDITSTKDRLAQYEEMLKPGQVITYTDVMRAEVERNPLVQSRKSTIAALEAELETLNLQGIRPDHREYRRIKARIEAEDQLLNTTRQTELRNQFNTILDGTRTLLRELTATEADLVKRAAELEAEQTKLNETLIVIAEIDDNVARLREQRGLRQADQARLEGVVDLGKASRVNVYQPPLKPDVRAFPKLIPMLAVGIAGCCGLAGAIVVGREVLDQRIKGPSDVLMIPRTRVIGLLPIAAEDPDAPKRFETIFRDAPQGVMAESLRQIRTGLVKRMAQRGHKSLLVVAAMPGSGGTSVATNLAFACAATDRRVLLIDANYRRPGIHKVFGFEDGPGLADVIVGEVPLPTAIRQTDTKGVDILPAGSRERRLFEQLGTAPLARVLAEASERYDLILVDTSPAVVSGDSSALASICDASLLVVRAMAEKRGMVARLKNELADGHAEFLGVLVNAVRASAGGYMRRNIRATFEYQTAADPSKDAPAAPKPDEGSKAA